ncbi:MAG TPA: alpha-glucan family phosphorylase, partial [Pirellulaceae bacterium]|nr:alpha-glucan family phosphorylase [Pirellulaceae bacterium]
MILPDKSLPLTLEELAQLVSRRLTPAETLTQLVELIQRELRSDVCSVYLVEPSRSHLVLAATHGLLADAVGKVRMPIREGLVGLVAEQMRPIVVEEAEKHPRFKYFPETGEEVYHSFLGVPIVDMGVLQGVLVLQTAAQRLFASQEVSLLMATATQVAPLVSELRTQTQFSSQTYDRARSLSRNLWWSWDRESNDLFRALAPTRWRDLDHNPVTLLSELPLQELENRVKEMVLHGRVNHAFRRLNEYQQSRATWGGRHAGVLWARPVAYFSAEFGLHESLPIYSGGLGVLAGDHLKSASDLGIPLVGIGLFYRQGYFRQRVDADGNQHEEYITNDPTRLPLELATDQKGHPIVVSIDTRSGSILARVWRLAVGRNTLLLLDSDVEGNSPEDRELTARLYGGDQRVRIRQELLLGVGGVRALRALKIAPGV